MKTGAVKLLTVAAFLLIITMQSCYPVPESLEASIRAMLDGEDTFLPRKMEEDSTSLYQAARALDEYSRGERRFYPDGLVRDAFSSFAFAYDWDENHAAIDVENSMSILSAFLNYAAYYARDINYLSTFASADHQIGILEYVAATSHHFCLYVIYREHGHFRVRIFTEQESPASTLFEGSCDITNIRKIGPDNARMYLLSSELPYRFSHLCCWYDNSGKAQFFVPGNYHIVQESWLRPALPYLADGECIILQDFVSRKARFGVRL
ncbi:MAG: hypothetical protein ACI399_06660, partial [Candidatus Cryptobacteroides sp.]